MARERKEVKEIFIGVKSKKLEINRSCYDIKFIHDIYKYINDKKLLGKSRKEAIFELSKFIPKLIERWRKLGNLRIPIRIELDEKTFEIYAYREVIIYD